MSRVRPRHPNPIPRHRSRTTSRSRKSQSCRYTATSGSRRRRYEKTWWRRGRGTCRRGRRETRAPCSRRRTCTSERTGGCSWRWRARFRTSWTRSSAGLHRWLDARNRTIRLADLLIEVENDLGFSVHFQQPGERVDPGEVCALLAAILAHGCNLGLYTMEKVAPDIAYRRLKNVSDWRLVEENQRAALAAIVHGISRLDAAGHWGDGTTSASDGQRFAMPQKVLQRTYSTRFNDFALEFYSFVADNYAPFYSRPVECTDRDAPFVLDGVLYHESDLNLEEHYTDTHGYTEINFAAFGMVGMRFCPRIRSLHRQRIYCADPARDHGVLEPVLQRGRRAVNFRLIAEQWDCIGQFYAAFPAGHATASAALQRLNRFQASNRFYAANRELGRALKTEFVLQYMSEPKLRAKVRRGLLKVEQLHALARAVYYGQRGRMRCGRRTGEAPAGARRRRRSTGRGTGLLRTGSSWCGRSAARRAAP